MIRPLAALAIIGLTGCAVTDPSTHAHVPFRSTVAMQATGTLRISEDAGVIRVIAWDQPRVQIEADKTGNSLEDATAIPITVAPEGGGVSITSHQFNFGINKNNNVNFIIHAPAGASLDLRTSAGVIESTGFTSDVNASLTAGQISLAMAKAAAPQHISARLTTGEVTIHLPKGAAASVDAGVLLGEKTVTFESAPAPEKATVDAHALLGEVRVEPALL
jgi:hypothetical protein